MSQRLALFGGSFNPIHLGHLIIARSMAEQLRLDRVIFLPSASPPHKTAAALLDPGHRSEMAAPVFCVGLSFPPAPLP